MLILLLADAEEGVLREDRSKAPLLMPLVRLGCKVEVEELTAGDAYRSGSWRLVGRPCLHAAGRRCRRSHSTRRHL